MAAGKGYSDGYVLTDGNNDHVNFGDVAETDGATKWAGIITMKQTDKTTADVWFEKRLDATHLFRGYTSGSKWYFEINPGTGVVYNQYPITAITNNTEFILVFSYDGAQATAVIAQFSRWVF
jgi:hypothetical protein